MNGELLAVLSNWGAGSSTLAAVAAILDGDANLAPVTQAWLLDLQEASARDDEDRGIEVLEEMPQPLMAAIYAITGHDDLTR